MEKFSSRMKFLAMIYLMLFISAYSLQTRGANLSSTNNSTILQMQVTGTVSDKNGVPIPGVTVRIKNSSSGTITNSDGAYTITVAPDASLIFTYLGFQTMEVPVDSRNEINIRLEEDVTALGEVEINAGYYYTNRRESTGNISKVTAEEIELQPVESPLQALQGRMPGVEIEQPSGVYGLASTIKIRGRNSLRFQGDYPLFIVDGVPVNSAPLSSTGDFSRGSGIDPLNALDVNNIESIEVLKDADATAIYGSRGANGVVLISTRKASGFGEKTSVEAQVYTGFSEVSNKMKMLNTSQYIGVREEAFENDGINPTAANAPDLVLWDRDRYTDWQEVLLGETATIHNVNLSVSGGNDNTSFRMGGSYQKKGAVFPGPFGYEKITSSLSVNHRSQNRKFNIAFSANYGVDNNKLFHGTNYVNQALTLSPNAPALYQEDGSLNWENGSWTNPLASSYQPQDIKSFSLLSNLNLSYELLNGLTIKANLGYSDLNSEETVRRMKNSYNPTLWNTITLFSNHSQTKRNSWIIEPQINYNKVLGELQLDALVGGTLQNNENSFEYLQGSGYSADRLVGNLEAADEVNIFTDESITYRYVGTFGRLGANWAKKYYLNLTGRRDGSSRFGQDKRFAGFWALGGAWIFSEEQLFQNINDILSFGKIRGSYGTTGSDQIPDYGYLDVYAPTPGPSGLYPIQLSNPDYSWEINKKLEAAIQLGFIKDRVNLEVSWYRNRSSNQLVGYPLSAVTGFSSVQANLPALIENTGWELLLGTTNIDNKSFSWITSLNATFPNNELLEFNDLELTPYRQNYKIGHPLEITMRYKYEGIDPETGMYRVADINNDGRLDFSDRVEIERLGRKHYWGLNNSFRFKNMNLSFFLEYVNQKGLTYLYDTNNSPGRFGNNSTEILNAWKQEGDDTHIQKLSQGIPAFLAYRNALESDFAVGDASFLRFKTITLTYQVPEKVLRSIGIQGLNLFLHGQNLFTITGYKGLDPQGGKVVPPLRTITSGFKLTI